MMYFLSCTLYNYFETRYITNFDLNISSWKYGQWPPDTKDLENCTFLTIFKPCTRNGLFIFVCVLFWSRHMSSNINELHLSWGSDWDRILNIYGSPSQTRISVQTFAKIVCMCNWICPHNWLKDLYGEQHTKYQTYQTTYKICLWIFLVFHHVCFPYRLLMGLFMKPI